MLKTVEKSEYLSKHIPLISQMIQSLSDAEDLNSACLIAEEHFQTLGYDLVSVLFCSEDDSVASIRPFRRLPRSLAELAPKMKQVGGCPSIKEAKRLLRPYDWKAIPSDRYDDFLSKRFLDEVQKLEYQSIIAVPILIGKGIALFSVGVKDDPSKSCAREEIISSVCQLVTAMVGLFPELTTLFEPKQLSTLQAKVLLCATQGYTNAEIAEFMDLSEMTIDLLFKSVSEKLGASNIAQTIAKALAIGEISNIQFGEHDII